MDEDITEASIDGMGSVTNLQREIEGHVDMPQEIDIFTGLISLEPLEQEAQ